jgi:capsular polysaccharide export protein
MLQGHPSRFWGELRDGLVADGHRVLKIHLCLADLVYWGRRPAVSYRGHYRNWRAWIERYLIEKGVTDILYYADRLPYHADALDAAKGLGIRCWAIEFGYLRPDWITMEPEGMAARSTFPKDPERIRALAKGSEAPNMVNLYPHDFSTEAFHEVTFHLLQAYGRPFYPLYNSDKIYWPAIDYLSWLGELAVDGRRKREAERLQAKAEGGALSYNLVAMQIQADYQIRCSSPYGHLSDFLDEVFTSFAGNAPASRHLVVKLHPLDNGLERWFSRIPKLARKAGIEQRVHVIRGGDLASFLRHSHGVVLVNSTVGLHALRLGLPTYAAGEAVFDVEGLTHQAPLDTFWTAPETVDMDLFHAFERALTTIQIKGSFYNADGRAAAIQGILDRLGGYSGITRSR